MIENGSIKRIKGSFLQADLSYEMRFMDESNLDDMMDLQKIVVHHLADKEIFRTRSADYFQEHLQREKSVIGVFCQDAACSPENDCKFGVQACLLHGIA